MFKVGDYVCLDPKLMDRVFKEVGVIESLIDDGLGFKGAVVHWDNPKFNDRLGWSFKMLLKV